MSRYRAVRGTFDLLPGQTNLMYSLENAARSVADNFGYREIRTPMFEEADLFTKGMGVLAGIVERELWTFHDKFGKKLALRADMTTGVVRALAQHEMVQKQNDIAKVFYLGTIFALGKEGEEGSRQCHQFGVEAIGSDNPALDAEIISLAATFCKELGLEGFVVELNSLGGPKSRPNYLKKLRDYFSAHSSELCSTCKRKYKAHPNWVLSCEDANCVSLAQVAPTIYGMLNPDGKKHFTTLREYLTDLEIPFELNPRVVRDMEYYNRTVFQIKVGDTVIAFGGRYDGLVEELGGKSTPAIGVAFNLEPIIDLLKQRVESEPEQEPPTVFLDPEGPEATKVLLPVLHRLRGLGVRADMSYANGHGSKMRKSARYLVKLNESNAFRGQALVENRDSGNTDKISGSRLFDKLIQQLGVEDQTSERPSGRRKLSRKTRRGKEEKDRDNRRKESSKTRDESSEEDNSKNKRRRRSRGEERKQESNDKRSRKEKPERTKKEEKRPRKESKPESNSETEKAVIPSLVIGIGAPEPTVAAKKQEPKAKKAESPPASEHVPEMSSGGLNWSIMPGAAKTRAAKANSARRTRKRKATVQEDSANE